MPDLATWLLERIAEDEAAARYWTCDCAIEGFPLQHGSRCEERVKAECAAKRRLVELHQVTVTREWVNPPDGPAYQEDERTCAICGWVPDACETVRILALPYADHPDYDQSWRPE